MSRAKSIFLACLRQPTPEARRAHAEDACTGDPALRERVHALLAAHARWDPEPLPEGERPGDVIGPYVLGETLGEGGFGVVHVAEQREPVRRRVALKVLKAGMDTRELLARFEAEKQVLALMDHPGIARVLDGGSTPGGRPYLVMELVEGEPIHEHCDRHRLTVRERLALFASVGRAVHHAHQKGVIHRDLKPSNVLVVRREDVSEPKVIDFGVAKLTGPEGDAAAVRTRLAQMIGTPIYMSPEQAELGALDVDSRADVYSLGVMLYELLTGTTPLTHERLPEASFDELRRLIREDMAPTPSGRLTAHHGNGPQIAAARRSDLQRLVRRVRGELDWIVMKAIEKDRARRYQSAEALVADVERYLANEPVSAGPPSRWYRWRKLARRNRAAIAVGAIFAAGALAAGWSLIERAARRALLDNGVREAMASARESYRNGRIAAARAAIQRAEGITAGGGASEALARAVAEWRRELEMLDRLEIARTESTTPNAEGRFDWARADRAYREAFGWYGLAVDAADPAAAAQRIERSPIRDAIVDALDEWVAFMQEGGEIAEASWALVQRADPDPWHRRIREAARRGDRDGLRRLARGLDAAARPAGVVRLLAHALALHEELELAVEILEQAHRRSPDDLWLNRDLDRYVSRLGPERAAEALAYSRAAVALRPGSAAVRLNLVVALSDRGDWPAAELECRELLRLHPDYARGHQSLALALESRGDLDGAIAELRRAIDLQPDLFGPRTNLGVILAGRGELDQAIALHTESTRRWPNEHGPYLNLGVALAGRGEHAAAAEAFREAITRESGSAEAHFNLGLALQSQGDLDGAIDALGRAIALAPGHARMHYRYGSALHHAGREGAVDALRAAIELDPGLAEAHCDLGLALLHEGDEVGAIAAFDRARELAPGRPEPYGNLGDILLRRGSVDAAIAALRAAVERAPERAAYRTTLGAALHLVGDIQGAIDAHNAAIAADPEHAAAWYNLGNALAAAGSTADAIAAHRRATKLDPGLGEAWVNLGNLLRTRADHDGARRAFEQAIEVAPDLWEAHLMLGVVHATAGEWEHAVLPLRQAATLRRDVWPSYWLGVALSKTGDVDGSIAAFRTALAIRADVADVHYELGNVLLHRDDVDGAMREYRAAIELRPDFAQAHVNLGNQLAMRGDSDGALRCFETALVTHPELAQAHVGMGILLERRGRLDDAAAEYREAIACQPQSAIAYDNLAQILLRQGHLDEAIELARQGIERQPDYLPTYHNLAVALELRGDLDGAIAACRDAIVAAPRVAESHRRLGLALLAQGQHDSALAAIEHAIELDPDHVEALGACAWLLADHPNRSRRDPSRAVALARRALQLDPARPEIETALALAYLRARDHTAAMTTAEAVTASSAEPGAFVWFVLAAARAEAGRADAARRALERGETAMPADEQPEPGLARIRAEATAAVGRL